MSADRYVATQPVRAAVKGRETEILEALARISQTRACIGALDRR